MKTSLQRILIGTIVFGLTQLIAVVGYRLAGWGWMDAIYMVVITIFGVGYGEVKPILDPGLRLFTIFVIVAGTSSAVYIVGAFLQMVTEGEINRAFGARRMTKEIEQLSQHVIICGFGRMGVLLARRMTEAGRSFVIVDFDEARIEQAQALGYLVRHGDATDEQLLAEAGITQAAVLATVLPNDAVNVFITLTARNLNPELLILARGERGSTEKKLLQAGANRVVLPASIGATRMAHLITHPASLDFLDTSNSLSSLNEILSQVHVQLDELPIPPQSELAGASIGTIEVRGRGSFIVVAIRRANGEMLIHPGAAVFLHAGDTLIVMGHRGDLPKFARQLAAQQKQRLYRGAKF
ncbi:potassium channel protein [filamentous cyanobacterium LEGE 11480]|uniref:Potassium channel protein n=1 Tax=Romeriopsis navalis LEGE 11480 TaxID=2777977 RepID=A0A928VPR6_9CYAN|nr:potassium channel protein [Romeriopsis navalis]MBE9032436.1 potassium channel protein [Romeriopsis navalis LEGE 11480]